MAYTPTILASGTVSNSATLTIDFSSFYTNYNTLEVHIIGLVPATTDTTLTMTISADGTTFATAAGSYEWASSFMAGGTGYANGGGSTSDTSITISQHVNTGSGGNASYIIRIHNVSSGSLRPFFVIDGVTTGTSLAMLSNKTYAQRLNAQVCRAIRLQMSSGNISSAYYKVVGTKI